MKNINSLDLFVIIAYRVAADNVHFSARHLLAARVRRQRKMDNVAYEMNKNLITMLLTSSMAA